MTVDEAFNTALQCHQQGDVARAAQLYQQVLAVAPGHIYARCNLAVILSRSGRPDQAVPLYLEVLRQAPQFAEAHFNLGNAYTNLGQFHQALASYQEAVRLAPQHTGMRHNLGRALVALGRLDEGIAVYRDALARDPNLVAVCKDLGTALHALGRHDEAIPALETYVRLRPDDYGGHHNLGLVYLSLGRIPEAAAMFETALRLRPDYLEARNALGIAREEQGRLDEAVACFQEVLAQQPQHVGALTNLATLYTRLGLLPEAIARYRQVLTAPPGLPYVHSNMLLALHYLPDPDPAALFAEHRAWGQRYAPLTPARPPARQVTDRLRIGYLSPDFRNHPVAAYIEGVLAAHDRSAFHITCYANTPRPDAVTERLRALADAWRPIMGMADEAVAQQIRQDGIDILVDLAGHTAGNRLLVLAQRPAPVQITHFGYPDTTGLEAVDYRLTDALADPPGQTERYSSERLLRLPELAWCYTPAADAPAVGPLPARAAGVVTFGSLNNLAKVTDQVLAAWAGILAAVPGSRLTMLAEECTVARRRVGEVLTRHGVDLARVELLPRLPRAAYWQLYQRLDVCLDPFPYNGGVTTCDALWMGVPVVSRVGSTYASRQGLCLLTAVGLPELAATSTEGYVQAAARLAADLDGLARLRAGLRERLRQSPVADPVRFTRHLEAAYREALRQAGSVF